MSCYFDLVLEDLSVANSTIEMLSRFSPFAPGKCEIILAWSWIPVSFLIESS
jgi:hypothetical protein